MTWPPDAPVQRAFCPPNGPCEGLPSGHGHGALGRTEDGGPAVPEVSGPMTVLESCLAPAFKLWRRNSPLMRRILGSIGGELLQDMLRLKKGGAQLISYADPVGTEAILGPHFAALLAEDFLLPFLGRMSALMDGPPGEESLGGLTVHLCPRTSHLLTALGCAEWRPFRLDRWEGTGGSRPMTYGEACLSCGGRVKFIGQMCLKNGGALLEDGVIQELVLTHLRETEGLRGLPPR